jgi:hypothetical protein
VEYAADHEARLALMALIVRMVDEVRVGLRAADIEEIKGLALSWSMVNSGIAPSELTLRLIRDCK